MSEETPNNTIVVTNDLSIPELQVLVAIINKAAQKGVFEPSEFKFVGHVYDRLVSFTEEKK